MRIQHNIPAMSAYRNYNNNTKSLSGNLEKLSSGYKINRAGDDAAGLAISEKMRAQITGLSAAQKNVKDGISLVKTAEGATQEIHDMLNRMAYLATQSANGTYDNDVDRANLQKEVEALKSEINRIADSANFNGINLLDGSMDAGKASSAIKYNGTTQGSSVINQSAGALPSSIPTSTVVHKDAVKEAKTSFYVDLKNLNYDHNSTAASTKGITLNVGSGTLVIAAASLNADTDAAGLAKLFTGNTTAGVEMSISGVSYNVTADGTKLKFEMTDEALQASTNLTSFTGQFAVKIDGYADIKTAGDGELQGGVNNATTVITEGSFPASKVLANTTFSQYAYTSANITDGAGFKAGDTTYVFALSEETLNTNFGGGFEVIDLTDLAQESGGVYSLKTNTAVIDYASEAMNRVSQITTNQMFSFGVKEGTTAGQFTLTFQEKDTYKGDADLTTIAGINEQFAVYGKVYIDKSVEDTGGKALQLQIGDTSEKFNQLKVSIGDMHTSALKINDLDIGTQEGAAAAIDVIKNAINYVSSVRGDLGATQNRLEHTGNNLSVMAENIQDAESTIRDTDVAEEMMSYVKNNILVQSAQAMLAQANQLPQGVLQLLG